jgi:hypothetical protein
MKVSLTCQAIGFPSSLLCLVAIGFGCGSSARAGKGFFLSFLQKEEEIVFSSGLVVMVVWCTTCQMKDDFFYFVRPPPTYALSLEAC